MMNELNKRANLLIEQLEVITFSFFHSYHSDSRECSSRESITAGFNQSPKTEPAAAQNNPLMILKLIYLASRFTNKGIC